MSEQIPEKMQAVVCHGPKDYRLEEVAVPERRPGEALIRVEAVGICASDLKCYHGAAKFWGDENRPAWAETMVIPGHEFAGIVVELDDEARAAVGHRGRRPGGLRADRPVLGVPVLQARPVPHVPAARPLRLQAPYPRRHGKLYGLSRRSIGAQDIQGHRACPCGVRRATLVLTARRRASPDPFEDTVVVAGCGPIGLGMIAGARAKNPMHVIALDMAPEKLKLAKRCGADITINIAEQDAEAIIKELTDGYGADVYLEGTGHPSAVPQGLNSLRKLGRYVEYGVFGSDVTVDWSIISDDKELDVLGAHLGPYCWPAAIKMIESGVLPMNDICTHQLPLTDFQKGLDLVASGKESVKVSLIPA